MPLGFAALRRRLISKPLMGWYQKALPSMSETERQALEAGESWWEAELFSGAPDWRRLRDTPGAALSDKEQAFLNGPVETFCSMIEDWDVEFRRRDLPPEAWAFLKEERFFGMIIPEEYGGLEFSAFAQSEVIRKIASRSVSAAVTVMVPNSLGPGELLLLYGEDAQRERYLPRLARGDDIPCFALTEPDAGSDAASMKATGVVGYGDWRGERTLGLTLNWDKRYMTLGPVSTIMGLAFRLHDPDRLIGEETDRGVTVALVPTNLDGVDMGARHFPLHLAFLNGPTRGRNVFVPLDAILGGEARIGEGWKMLMGALAAGRAVSLPALSTAAAQLSARTSGAYARVREQFGLSIGEFEGVREPLARIAGTTYLLDSARRFTASGVDSGVKPAVASAIAKLHSTMRMRDVVNDAMDIHAGKSICAGPKNYLETAYRAIPVGVTVEGANILTRSLIVFGQGAIRAHPYLTPEMDALANPDKKAGLLAFDKAIWGHIGRNIACFWRSWFHNLTGGRFAAAPHGADGLKPFYRQLSRASASFAVAAEVALAALGGALKRKEALSGRLGDILSELYLLSAALKRFEDDGCPEEDLPLLRWCFAEGLFTIERRLIETARNFPSPVWGGVIACFATPAGAWRRPPSDDLMHACATLILTPGPTRERLTGGLFLGGADNALALLDEAFERTVAVEEARAKMKKGDFDEPETAAAAGVLTKAESAAVRTALAAVARVVAVDEFPAHELTGDRPLCGRSEKTPAATPARASAFTS